jgi:hypothetical protein
MYGVSAYAYTNSHANVHLYTHVFGFKFIYLGTWIGCVPTH